MFSQGKVGYKMPFVLQYQLIHSAGIGNFVFCTFFCLIVVKSWLASNPCRIGSLSNLGRPCSDHGWNMVKERVLTMFQTSTLNGHHCQNMVETRSSDHVLTMVETCSSDHALTMVDIDYGWPWFDRGGHLTLMFKTWSNMVSYWVWVWPWSDHVWTMVDRVQPDHVWTMVD